MIIRNARLLGTYFEPRQLPHETSPKIVLVGRSNVGKSSLINHLLNRRRLAKTSSAPGKTLSVNYYMVNERLILADLPGYGFARTVPADRQRVEGLVAAFFASAENVRLLLLLIDCRRGFLEPDRKILADVREAGFPVLTILTKSDKISTSQAANQKRAIQNELGLDAIPFSIQSDKGSQETWRRIEEAVNAKE
jgi:GTP-binding protein